ncbi:hypothetical protein [Massilia sp. Leaf139]|uniref:hypothetical protein n=1 Tax=Massilia sp. Leaf139 TaxID=1736272 RepID=UPI000B1479CD|nr:hypothetical protein [Massilia sp. Leaf139]
MTSVTKKALPKKRPSYLNPFEGRAKRIRLSGLFLFDPEVSMRLQGITLRGTFIEMGEESLFKGLERASQTGQLSRELKTRLLRRMPRSIASAMSAAFDAPEDGSSALAQMGMWEAHLMAVFCDDNGDQAPWPASAQFILNVERASRNATILCNENQFQAAAEYLANHPLLKQFMSSEVLKGIAYPPDENEMLALRLSMALELWLSLLAIWDLEAKPDRAADELSYLEQLLPSDSSNTKNTVALLFDWLLRTAKIPTPAALLKDKRLGQFSVDPQTLGAWSRGTNFPSTTYRTGIANRLLSTEDAETFERLCAAARQLNFLGYVAQELERMLGAPEGARAEQRKLFGLSLPFGHDTIEAWMRSRYPVWLQFHKKTLGKQNAAPLAAADA